jgi:hypothetical protein
MVFKMGNGHNPDFVYPEKHWVSIIPNIGPMTYPRVCKCYGMKEPMRGTSEVLGDEKFDRC